MDPELILETNNVAKLELLLEEATRSTQSGVSRFIEPASGTLNRATSRQHHLVFGRRGSGKSSLLRKAAADLTVDRRPIAFVDLETFKGHAYPDVLLSVLIETFEGFAEWLEEAAIAPANRKSFWSKLFGRSPTRRPFDKIQSAILAESLRKAVTTLNVLLNSDDDVEVEVRQSRKTAERDSQKGSGALGPKSASLALTNEQGRSAEYETEQTERYRKTKLDHLHRHILEYQKLFRQMSKLSDGDSFLFLDDLYHIRKRDQAEVIDYFHRIGKGNNLWLKIGTIRHRTQWYINGDPPIGAKIGDDINDIDLDLTLEKYNLTRTFLGKVLGNLLNESDVKQSDLLSGGALDRLVLASGGVTRDFLGVLRQSILMARERGKTYRGHNINVEDVNNAAGNYDSSKREELSRDTLDESQKLEEEFGKIGSFVRNYAKANVFLLDKSLPDSEIEPIEELVDLRLVHRVKSSVTVADRPGKKFEAYMLDISQYTASRKLRDLKIIEFWGPDATDTIRRTGLIYKEYVNNEVVVKSKHMRH